MGRSPARDAGLRTPNQLHPVGPGNAGAHNVLQDRAIQPAHRHRAVHRPERQFVRPGHEGNDSNVRLVAGGIPPNKSDLTRFYGASEVISGYPAPNTQHVLLYLAWERSNVLGSANMDFEINKVADAVLGQPPPFPIDCTINRSNGDILVTYDFTGGGGIRRSGSATGTARVGRPAAPSFPSPRSTLAT
jgi:hypothetical protein